MIGQTISHYHVLERLGGGGMGVVYRARDERLRREVALKFLSDQITHDDVAVDRFLREAQAASALNHPNIITIYDVGESPAGRFLVMELVAGRTLRAVIAERPSSDEIIHLGQQIARALVVAHEAGIVHRDIKPENVMVRTDGLVKVLDFGLARLLPTATGQSSEETVAVTGGGLLVGTTAYMSPEQLSGETLTSAADVFAFGVVLYELATGQHPFLTASPFSTAHAILSQPAASPARLNAAIPSALDAVILQMLRKDARQRPPASEIATTLSALVEPKTPTPTYVHIGLAVPPPVGREKQIADLHAALQSVTAGRGLLLCVSGEPGIGKTTVVESFLDELHASEHAYWVARGRCSERLAGTEAYLPVLEALDHLLRGDAGDAVARMMRLLAPTWYAQIAPLAPTDPPSTRVLVEGRPSQERLKRELDGFLQDLTRLRPLVLFLDDVHWVDLSTVDLLAYLGVRMPARRLLVIVTYRPTDLLLGKHPFVSVKLDLQSRGVCREFPLEFLRREDVDRYMALEFPNHGFPREFGAVIHAKTEGSPLFMADLLRYLRDRHVIAKEQGRWVLVGMVPALERELPESVRSMIQRKIDQLDDVERRMLSTASAQGYEFDAAVVARALAMDPSDVEERLDTLERVQGFVRRVKEQEFPDRTLTLRFRFVHVLYQNAFYASLTPARKMSSSAAVAEALLSFHGEQRGAVAHELAFLFEAARDPSRACEFFLLAARNAAGISAVQEVTVLSRRGLELVKAMADGPDKIRRELELQTTLGRALSFTKGWAAPEVEQTYSRARVLCKTLGESPALFPILWGLWAFFCVRAEIPTACELLEQLNSLAKHDDDSAFLLEAHFAHGDTFLWIGRFLEARAHLEQGVALYDSSRHSSLAFSYVVEPLVYCRGFLAHVLWYLGYPDQALKSSDDALALARHVGHPRSLIFASGFRAWLHEYRREAQLTQEWSERTVELLAEQEAAFLTAQMTVLRGWARVERGQREDGLSRIRQGLDAYRAGGAELERVHWLALLAEAYDEAGQQKEGLDALSEALDTASRTGIRFCEAELWRLKGELWQRRPVASGGPPVTGHDRGDSTDGHPSVRGEIEACFRRSIEIARRQEAKSLELRAVMGLSRCLHDQGKSNTEARAMLAEIYGWFTEGFDTADLKEAKALLDELQ